MRTYSRKEIDEFIEDALLSQPQTVCVGHIDMCDGDVPIMLDTTEAVSKNIILQLLGELDALSTAN